MSTLIEWTDVTDNILVVKGGGHWCRKISPGCLNCYAATLNQNAFFGGNGMAYSGNAPEMELREGVLAGWPRQRTAKRHFVASMTDVFGDWVGWREIFKFLDAMEAAPMQTFQVLTKRAENMADRVSHWLSVRGLARVPSNIWLGFSAENQAFYNTRAHCIAGLRKVCDVLWVSAEPLIGPLSLGTGFVPDWVVVGGESGTDARQCDIGWIRSLVKECREMTVPVFVKQMGAFSVVNGGRPEQKRIHFKHKKGGDPTEWPHDLRVRQFPQTGCARGDGNCGRVLCPRCGKGAR